METWRERESERETYVAACPHIMWEFLTYVWLSNLKLLREREMSFRECVLMMLVVFMSQFQVVKADSGDVFATLLAYVFFSLFCNFIFELFFLFGSLRRRRRVSRREWVLGSQWYVYIVILKYVGNLVVIPLSLSLFISLYLYMCIIEGGSQMRIVCDDQTSVFQEVNDL